MLSVCVIRVSCDRVEDENTKHRKEISPCEKRRSIYKEKRLQIGCKNVEMKRICIMRERLMLYQFIVNFLS